MKALESTKLLKEALAQRILLLDGAMGTMIQAHKLQDADFRGERFKDHDSELGGNSDLPLYHSASNNQRYPSGLPHRWAQTLSRQIHFPQPRRLNQTTNWKTSLMS